MAMFTGMGSSFPKQPMGIAMVTGYLTTFSYWLLKAFPALSTIG
jgi:hypothetical protein